MQVRNALEQLDLIHDHLTRSEVYRGFRVSSVALVGILAFVASAAQPLVLDDKTGTAFVAYWVAVAGLCSLIGTGAAIHRFVTREDGFARRRTRRVLAQFAPCVLVGAVVSVAIARSPDCVAFLPGLWGMIFGLGLIATRPHLPPGIGLIGFGYVTASAAMLLRVSPNDAPSGWAVGLVFGVGHLLTAFMLWRGAREETDD